MNNKKSYGSDDSHQNAKLKKKKNVLLMSLRLHVHFTCNPLLDKPLSSHQLHTVQIWTAHCKSTHSVCMYHVQVHPATSLSSISHGKTIRFIIFWLGPNADIIVLWFLDWTVCKTWLCNIRYKTQYLVEWRTEQYATCSIYLTLWKKHWFLKMLIFIGQK